MENLFTKDQLKRMVSEAISDIVNLWSTKKEYFPHSVAKLMGKGIAKMNKAELVIHIKDLQNARIKMLSDM